MWEIHPTLQHSHQSWRVTPKAYHQARGMGYPAATGYHMTRAHSERRSTLMGKSYPLRRQDVFSCGIYKPVS